MCYVKSVEEMKTTWRKTFFTDLFSSHGQETHKRILQLNGSNILVFESYRSNINNYTHQLINFKLMYYGVKKETVHAILLSLIRTAEIQTDLDRQ